jgi:diphthamide synthase (EF-2-diphthine--ammonia ligase)
MTEKAPVHQIAEKHFKAMLAEAETAGLSRDALGRTLLWMIIDVYRETRSQDDIKSEFEFVCENLDPEGDLIFMRP